MKASLSETEQRQQKKNGKPRRPLENSNSFMSCAEGCKLKHVGYFFIFVNKVLLEHAMLTIVYDYVCAMTAYLSHYEEITPLSKPK